MRHFVDGLFPQFAKFPLADSQAVGWGHRYRAGHDLFLDVPSTTINHGVVDGYKHAGHIVLTDFPTKAGIPIPGFSQSGLGEWLEGAGISRGWLNLNICDAGVGILAVAEASPDLLNAFDGNLVMDSSVFFDTFLEGGLEVALAVYTGNPILMLGGVQNILAGIVSTWDTISVYVDPFLFFGSSFTSALIGFVVGFGIAKQSLPDAIESALKSGTVGAFFSISAAFGFGAISGLLAITAGRHLAKRQCESASILLKVDRCSLNFLIEEITSGSPNFFTFFRNIECRLMSSDFHGFSANPEMILVSSVPILSADRNMISDEYFTLSTQSSVIKVSKERRTNNWLHLTEYPLRGNSVGEP